MALLGMVLVAGVGALGAKSVDARDGTVGTPTSGVSDPSPLGDGGASDALLEKLEQIGIGPRLQPGPDNGSGSAGADDGTGPNGDDSIANPVAGDDGVDALDSDGDGLADRRERELGTEVFDPDTDGDGVADGREIDLSINPLNPDTDGDGVTDGAELQRGTSPRSVDADADGLENLLQDRLTDAEEWAGRRAVYDLGDDRLSTLPPAWHDDLAGVDDLETYVTVLNEHLAESEASTGRGGAGTGVPTQLLVTAATILGDFDRAAVSEFRVARNPRAAPVYERGYLDLVVPYDLSEAVGEGVYYAGMASRAQYPERSLNGGIVAGFECADRIAEN